MLKIAQLSVSINEQHILKRINLSVKPGSIHAIMGPNGSGKSTLAYTLVGHPSYQVIKGSIVFNEQDIVQLSPDKRAKLGIFLAFQHPCAIPGVSVMSFLKEVYHAVTNKVCSVDEFKSLLEQRMQQLDIDPIFVHRSLNDGFSGGEKKRFEMLQMLLLQPKLVILDEIDSGLDIDALKVVANAVKIAREENPQMSIILITHYQRILQFVHPNYVHVFCDGELVKSGNAQLVDELESKGYYAYKKTAKQVQ